MELKPTRKPNVKRLVGFNRPIDVVQREADWRLAVWVWSDRDQTWLNIAVYDDAKALMDGITAAFQAAFDKPSHEAKAAA